MNLKIKAAAEVLGIIALAAVVVAGVRSILTAAAAAYGEQAGDQRYRICRNGNSSIRLRGITLRSACGPLAIQGQIGRND